MEGQPVRFYELLSLHLNNVIKKRFTNCSLDPKTLREVRDVVREQVSGVFGKSSLNVSPEAVNWVANQFFKAIRFNDDQSLAELVIINEYKLTEMPYLDIELLKNLFSGTTLGVELREEYDRRSQA